MSDPAGKPMDPASFLIQVQFRQNATWQGSIQWLDKKRPSVLEARWNSFS